MELFKGNLVKESASGMTGVISDRDTGTGHCLVRFDRGEDQTSLDATHGRWLAVESLTKVGHDAEALVWWITRMAPAGPDEGAPTPSTVHALARIRREAMGH